MPPISRPLSHEIRVAVSLYAVIAIVVWVFWPGLTGDFLFDDFPNLAPMGKHGGITSWDKLYAFVMSGSAGSLGRPLSMLSFALNDQYWPASPEPFKYTNLLIHVICTILVFALCRLITQALGKSTRAGDWIALLAAATWALHPLQVSTVFLVVQRMTQLSALFTLGGLIFYTAGRLRLNSHAYRGLLLMSLGIGLFGCLATLSKENGILLPLYALVLEATAFSRNRPTHRLWRLWRWGFLLAPLLLLTAYLAFRADHILHIYEYRRDFTLEERLLSAPRILFTYLYHLLTFRVGGTGLFHDDFSHSTSIFAPWTTLPALIALCSLTWVAIAKRRRYPVFAFAVLWFIAGHSLEGSVIPLELYFEHRNYLPLIGPALGLACFATSTPHRHQAITIGTLCIIVGISVILTRQNAYIWGDTNRLAEVWVKENPQSVRARQLAANTSIKRGHVKEALDHLEKAHIAAPRFGAISVGRLQLRCLTGVIEPEDITHTTKVLSSAHYDTATSASLGKLRTAAHRETCAPTITAKTVQRLAQAALSNPNYLGDPKIAFNLHYLNGMLYLDQRDLAGLVESLDDAYSAYPLIDVPLLQASALISAGLYKDAERYLDLAETTPPRAEYSPKRHAQLQYITKLRERIADLSSRKQPTINHDHR
ncbi:tetratricopeptide repeat protein [Alkalilimnicola sp. S0819]|uniref:tetratricopeptide repeat protein n=1 Tax=Alkalilimnicola sp. S0819 TaxID=2613922 RepID=UPI0012620F0F|nr:hypothetical protein [Alkalilimnicola sp. S0819]KAB7623794.1 hypothetical protein F3N43_08465 [Alkalilimnicola sp. S0819]MPQ16668.1 hypothetical protein [Alkalilimnicola sp. S0819]